MSFCSKILFSFIIPTTGEKEIKKVISSIILSNGWNPQDCEIIIIANNYLSCFPEKLSKELSFLNSEKNNIIVEYLKEKANISIARNRGIKLAQGEYIVYIDDDCKLSFNYISLLKEIIKKNRFLIARGKVKFVPSPGIFLSNVNSKLRNLAYSKRKSNTYTPNLIVKKGLHKKVGRFDKKLFHGEDLEWNQKVKNHKIKIVSLNKLVISHYDHESCLNIISNYFRYGIGRTYRFAKYFLKNGSFIEKLKFVWKLFDEIPSFKFNFSLREKAGFLFLYIIRDIGVLYGILILLFNQKNKN